MKLPKNLTEQQVVDTIDNVVDRLAKRFIFGYHDVDDMKQQGRLFAIEGLDRYDGKRPLENFLWTHVRNRLSNYKRDNYERQQLPCFQCVKHNFDNSNCYEYDDMLECKLYHRWYMKNSAKKNLMSPIELEQVHSETEQNMSVDDNPYDNAIGDEITGLIEQNIPISLRPDYIRMKNHIKIPKPRKDKIQESIKKILIDSGYWKE